MVSGDESQADLFNELKARTFETGNEHALVTLSGGDQAIVSGGAEGITNMDIENLIAHTHPYQLPATGVSDADYAALNQLGQENSILLEQGQEISSCSGRASDGDCGLGKDQVCSVRVPPARG